MDSILGEFNPYTNNHTTPPQTTTATTTTTTTKNGNVCNKKTNIIFILLGSTIVFGLFLVYILNKQRRTDLLLMKLNEQQENFIQQEDVERILSEKINTESIQQIVNQQIVPLHLELRQMKVILGRINQQQQSQWNLYCSSQQQQQQQQHSTTIVQDSSLQCTNTNNEPEVEEEKNASEQEQEQCDDCVCTSDTPEQKRYICNGNVCTLISATDTNTINDDKDKNENVHLARSKQLAPTSIPSKKKTKRNITVFDGESRKKVKTKATIIVPTNTTNTDNNNTNYENPSNNTNQEVPT